MNQLICFLGTHSIHQKLLPISLLTAQNWNSHYKLQNKVSDQNLCVTRWERTLRTESVYLHLPKCKGCE